MEAIAKLNNYPTSPRKMRLLADLIRGMKVEKALAILDHNPKHPAVPLRKLLLSAINNWKQKNEGADESGLIVKTIFVDGARVIKRMRPAPQGRGYRVRKRSNHVTIIVDSMGSKVTTAPAVVEEAVVVEETPKPKNARTTKKA
jgi:large subunit ribosomal protein L22